MSDTTVEMSREKFVDEFEQAAAAYTAGNIVEAVRQVAHTTRLVRVGSTKEPGCLVAQAGFLQGDGVGVGLAIRCDTALYHAAVAYEGDDSLLIAIIDEEGSEDA